MSLFLILLFSNPSWTDMWSCCTWPVATCNMKYTRQVWKYLNWENHTLEPQQCQVATKVLNLSTYLICWGEVVYNPTFISSCLQGPASLTLTHTTHPLAPNTAGALASFLPFKRAIRPMDSAENLLCSALHDTAYCYPSGLSKAVPNHPLLLDVSQLSSESNRVYSFYNTSQDVNIYFNI